MGNIYVAMGLPLNLKSNFDGNISQNKDQCCILFHETRAIARIRADTHASKFMCAIYRTREIIIFSLLVLLLLYISREKFFIKGFFIEDYVNEI